MGAGTGAAVGLLVKKLLATCSYVVASTVPTVGFSVLVFIFFTVAASFNISPIAYRAGGVPLKIIGETKRYAALIKSPIPCAC